MVEDPEIQQWFEERSRSNREFVDTFRAAGVKVQDVQTGSPADFAKARDEAYLLAYPQVVSFVRDTFEGEYDGVEGLEIIPPYSVIVRLKIAPSRARIGIVGLQPLAIAKAIQAGRNVPKLGIGVGGADAGYVQKVWAKTEPVGLNQVIRQYWPPISKRSI
jgi:hypothetical protein